MRSVASRGVKTPILVSEEWLTDIEEGLGDIRRYIWGWMLIKKGRRWTGSSLAWIIIRVRACEKVSLWRGGCMKIGAVTKTR